MSEPRYPLTYACDYCGGSYTDTSTCCRARWEYLAAHGERVPEIAARWQPIDSAPLDGTPILAWWGNDSSGNGRPPLVELSMGVTLYVATAKAWVQPDDWGNHYGEPTHWQPLPAPPEVTP